MKVTGIIYILHNGCALYVLYSLMCPASATFQAGGAGAGFWRGRRSLLHSEDVSYLVSHTARYNIQCSITTVLQYPVLHLHNYCLSIK